MKSLLFPFPGSLRLPHYCSRKKSNVDGSTDLSLHCSWPQILIAFFVLNSYQFQVFSQSEPVEEPPPLAHTVVIPPAPTAAALGEYGTYEVNMASGLPEIRVPLTEIKNNNVSLPISLSYHGAGNRVDEVPGWVGLGWSLNAGGVITRTMQGNPDEDSEKGFLQTGQWIQGKTILTDADYVAAKDVVEGFSDTTPDIFSFNFAGYSGKFYVDFDGNARLMPAQPIKILPFVNFQSSVGFIIITEDGTKYLFEEEEKSDYQMGRFYFTSSWYLTSIISADGFDRIDLHYGTHSLKYPLQENIAKLYEFNGLDLVQSQRHISRSAELITVSQAKKLQSIDFKQGVAQFYWTAEEDEEAQLNQITVKATAAQLPATIIDFDYSRYPEGQGCQANECYRRRLDEVAINQDKRYGFKYDDQPFPPFDSYDRDHWGYYNAAGNSSPIPTYKTPYNTTAGDNANRLPNAAAMQIGVLKEVQHPTGGITKFEFEPNKLYYFDQPGGNHVDITMPLNFQLTVTQPDTHVITQDFPWPGMLIPFDDGITLDDITWNPATTYSVEFGTMPSTFNTGYNGSPKVQLFNSEGFDQTVPLGSPSANDFDPLLGMYVSRYQGTMLTSPAVPHTVRLQTGDEVGNYAKVKLTATGSYAAQQPVYDDGHIIVGGLRVKSIKNYSTEGEYLNGKRYTYEKAPEASSAKLLMGSWQQFKSNVLPYLATYNYELGCFDPGSPAKVVLHDNPIAQLGAPVIMYEKVQEAAITESGQNNGYVENTFEIWADNIDHMIYPNPPRMEEGWRRGQISNKKVYRIVPGTATAELVKEERFSYELSAPIHTLRAAKIVQNRCFLLDRGFANSDESHCFVDDWTLKIAEYAYAFYDLTSQWKYLTKHETIDYYDQGVVTTVVDYTYTAGFPKLLRSKTTTVDGETTSLKEETVYPFDITSLNTDLYPMSSSLMAIHAIGLPVERRTSRVSTAGEEVIRAELIEYVGAKPHKIYSLKASTPISNFEECESSPSIDFRYGDADFTVNYAASKILSQVRRDDVRLRYLWNDGFNVTCETVLATDGFIGHTSFEESSITGGWSGTAVTRESGGARTGRWYGKLDNNSVLNCSLNGSGDYVLTFWVKDNNSVTVESDGMPVSLEVTERPGSDWKLCESAISVSIIGTQVTIRGTTLIDEVRIHPREAEMTTFTYRPLTGVTSITDSNNNTSYYEYDASNRLIQVSDQYRNILKLFDYRFKTSLD